MTNKEFEDNVLNYSYIQFYRQSIISLHAAFIAQGKTPFESSYLAIEKSQFLMEEMGYTNTLGE